MLKREYEGQHCSIARALEVVGERWSALIVRDAFLGIHRFDDLVKSLGITRSVLSGRLEQLVGEGVLERRRYAEHPARFEYHLTAKGLDLWPALIGLLKWGDRHYRPPGGRPRIIVHVGCGGEVDRRTLCTRCRRRLGPEDVEAVPGPGAAGGLPTADATMEAKGDDTPAGGKAHTA